MKIDVIPNRNVFEAGKGGTGLGVNSEQRENSRVVQLAGEEQSLT